MRSIVGFRCEALRRLGEVALPLRRQRVKSTPFNFLPWVLIVVGAMTWFALNAIYGFVVTS
jgi:hypothetical protein